MKQLLSTIQVKNMDAPSSKYSDPIVVNDNVVPGQTALEKMKHLAGGLYQSTPNLDKGIIINTLTMHTYRNAITSNVNIYTSRSKLHL